MKRRWRWTNDVLKLAFVLCVLVAMPSGSSVAAAASSQTTAAATSASSQRAVLAPPVVTLPPGVTRLDDIGLYRVSYHYLTGGGGVMPVGWTGHFEDSSGISCTPFGSQDGKNAFLLHPPWRGGTGATTQEFRLALPHAKHISLQFAIAMRRDAIGPGKSDGATFRVILNKRILMDQNKTDASWSNYHFDLSADAGKTVELEFQTDPGPKHDASFDFALWGDRVIDVAGAAGSVGRQVTIPTIPLSPITTTWGNASPASASLVSFPVRIDPHPDGLLSGWSFLVAENAAPGHAPSNAIGIGSGSYLDLVGDDGKTVRSDSPAVKVKIRQTLLSGGAGVRRVAEYQVGKHVIFVTADLHPARGGTAKVELSSDDPFIAAVHFGDVGPAAFRKQITVPYLGQVSYLPDLGLYANSTVDYSLSHASSMEGTTAVYGALTDGRRNQVSETAYYSLTPDFYAVLPTPPNPPSPYRAELGHRIVFDSWGGAFRQNAAWLKELATYRLNHLDIIAHDWQNGGYDNKLPNVLPANPALGGNDGMKEWANTALGLGEIFSLHENYVDFYPNAAVYTEQDVARDSQNRLIPAWKNIIQSYAEAPTAMLKYARMFTPQVQALFGENGSFIDVNSSVAPWFHVDFRAGEPGAGQFHTVWNAHRDLWKLMRDVHHGPVLGEGNHHWYWSGLLDGAEAQFGQGVPDNGGETAPLFVDFDLMKIHPLQLNHGMGYIERWLSDRSKLSGGVPMKTLDQYRMQEIAYGHAGFVSGSLVRSLPFVWQEHNLVLPVSERFALASPRSIRYEVNGKMLDTNAAIASGTDFGRVQITYDNGLAVWANNRPESWVVETPAGSIELPQFGWLAQGTGVVAYTGLRGGVVGDYAETPISVFADARTSTPAAVRPLNVTPRATDFKQTGPRQFQLTFGWDVQEAIPTGESQFIHVTGAGSTQGENIVFQMGAGMPGNPDTWPVGKTTTGQPVLTTLPNDLKDGRYEVKTGLYAPDRGGQRLMIMGKDDGSHRISVGTLVVSDAGKTITFEPAAAEPDRYAALAKIWKEHTNPEHKILAFGKIATDGSVLLEKQARGVWLLTPYPRNTSFLVALESSRLDPALKTVRVTAVDANQKDLGPVSTSASAIGKGWVQFKMNTIPGAYYYRLQR